MKKISFSDRYGLTQAVIDLIKTNTRRAERSLDVLPLYYNPLITEFLFEYKDGIVIGRRFFKGSHVETYHLKPRYKVGEVVAVSQRYKDAINPLDWVNTIIYKNSPGWTNKMFVCAELMPHRIRITDIKVERLQNISHKDCLKEGITTITEGKKEVGNGFGWDTMADTLERDTFFTAKAAFTALIDRISGRGTWERNPWVYAYEFELIK